MALELATAERIVKGAVARAQEMGVKLSIAVVDEKGILVHLSRMDGAPFLSPQIAMGKAYTAAAWGVSSGEMEQRAQSSLACFSSIAAMTGGKTVFRKGALPIIIDGQVVGAAGASGGTSDEDEEAIRGGLAAIA
ncbi:MAG: GlcG/HbpS family heme-binding protein [Sphingomonadaceae bacterium]